MANPSRQTPRERVLTALSHCQPERVPFSWGFGPTGEMSAQLASSLAPRGISWPRLRTEVDDCVWVSPTYIGPPLALRTDIWGVRREVSSYGGGHYDEIACFPLAGVETTAQLDAYPWPTADACDYAGFRAAVEAANPGRLRATKLSDGGNPFEIYCWMTGLEESLMNLVVCPDLVAHALRHITDYFEERLRRSLAAAGDLIDLVFLADDLGGQNGLLLSRENYRDVIRPAHRRLTAAVRDGSPQARTLYHSDGAVFDILPDLIDAGVQVLEAVQTDAAGMEPERLKAAYGERLSFHGAISVQQLLPNETPAQVAAECRALARVLGEGGGYIAAPSHAVQFGTPVENVLAMLEAVLGEAEFDKAMASASADARAFLR